MRSILTELVDFLAQLFGVAILSYQNHMQLSDKESGVESASDESSCMTGPSII